MPAFDHLAFAEMKERNHLSMLFADTGDLRNVIETVNGLADGNGADSVNVVINDEEPYVAARTVFVLLLFGGENISTLAVETAIHLWYSAFLTKEMAIFLEQTWKSSSWERMRGEIYNPEGQGEPEEQLSGETTTGGGGLRREVDGPNLENQSELKERLSSETILADGGILRVDFARRVWKLCFDIIDNIVDGPLSTSVATASRHDITLLPQRADYRDRVLCWINPRLRIPLQNYWRDGMVLPFASSRELFTCPNL